MPEHFLRSYAELLPRLYELKSSTDTSHPDAYFRDFERRFEDGRTVLPHYQKVEQNLAVLEDSAWQNIKGRAAQVAHVKIAGRGWQALFDVLNEAKAYGYLKHIGCTDIEFIERTKTRTPDLSAIRNGRHVLCEVKTINVSQEEAAKRESVSRGEFVVGNVATSVSDGFLGKVEANIAIALDQFASVDASHNAERIIFTVLHFDDWVGDYQTEYIAQLDEHLRQRPVMLAELVFAPVSNLFGRKFMMRAAAIFQD